MESAVPDKITVLLADDHGLVRRGFRRMLDDDAAIEVVGEAGDGDEAVVMANALRPQVIVMDCAMPKASGLEATRRILAGAPGIRVLMLSMHSEPALMRQALAAGASGYILKSAIDLDLAAAVKRVAAGETVVDAVLEGGDSADARHGLTQRELEVLQLICDGLSNREIAARLDLSVNTVSVHRTNIMNALDVHKAAELVVYAMRHGLVKLP
jgi:DNA-binding NarL/FixJ family response regulator